MNIIASPGIDDDLAKQSLRIIGNTCIDTGSMIYLLMHSFVNACSLDENRDRVIASNVLPFIISLLQTEPWLAIPVLINIVADYGGNMTLLVLQLQKLMDIQSPHKSLRENLVSVHH